jgi:hypothetical protein
MKRMNRRQFSKELAFLSGITVTLGACGGGGGTYGGGSGNPASGNPPPTSNPSGDKVGQVSDNHGHSAVVTSAQLAAGASVTVNIEGTAGHPHTISLPAAAIEELKLGRSVVTNSTTQDGHLHTVTFNGTTSDPPSRY